VKVLLACEASGIVRDAFTAKGHHAVSCDLLPSETEGEHYQGDVFDILYDGWDMMIAFPPCTYTSNAGAVHLYPGGMANGINEERYAKGMEGKAFFMKLLNADHIPKRCVENPISSKVFEMPQHTQTVQPYEYGHPYKKATRLWLRNLPDLVPTKMMDERESTKVVGNWFNKAHNRQQARSRFWPGIAEAMADQWG
jgi:hypothetical protein